MASLLGTSCLLSLLLCGSPEVGGDRAWDTVPLPTTATTHIPKAASPPANATMPSLRGSSKKDTAKNDEGPPLSTDAAIAAGVIVSEAKCKTIADAAWVRAAGRNFCIRYWLSSAGGKQADPLIYLHGDIGGLIEGKLQLVEAARRITDAGTRQSIEPISRLLGGPYGVIARPGSFGSSGHHIRDRRTMAEILAISETLDALKERHGFKRFHMIGLSGGGHTVAALARIRDDLGCAVIGSGSLSIRTWYRDAGRPITPAVLAEHDPIAHVSKMKHRPGLRLVVVSDPDDQTVSFRSQREFVERVKGAGLPILHITAAASDKKNHHLHDRGIRLAIDCAKDMDDQALIARHQTKPFPKPTEATAQPRR